MSIPPENRPELKRLILSTLKKGRAHALPGKVIAAACRYEPVGSDRLTRMMIRELIEEGYPIASTTVKPAGFFLAETKEEVERYAQSIRGRLIEDALRRRDFLRASRPILQPEQMKMEV
jgi:hypothetical protein|tara:strand:- start:1092 stop:1448 length:357 start_codon:yes stop_codon:yes gene_type:complete